MNKNLNCKYNDKGAWCTHDSIPRSMFGLGARQCIEFNGCDKCEFKVKYNRPNTPPPPPKPPCRKVTGYWGVLLNKDELDQYEKDSKAWRENNKLFHHTMESFQEKRLKFLRDVDKAIQDYFMYKYNVDLSKVGNVNNFKLNERFHCIESVACSQKDYYDSETCYLTVVDDPLRGCSIERHGW